MLEVSDWKASRFMLLPEKAPGENPDNVSARTILESIRGLKCVGNSFPAIAVMTAGRAMDWVYDE